jgi:hypothetical protein
MPELDTATIDKHMATFFRERTHSLAELAEPYTMDDFIRAFDNLRKTMLRMLNGLNETQVCFSPDDNTYSISEVVTHLIAAQGHTYNAFLDIAASTRPHIDPVPRGRGAGAEKGVNASMLQHRLEKASNDLLDLIRSTYDENHKGEVDNPFLGKLSYKAWMLFQLGHDLDHLKQAQALRRSPLLRSRAG